MRSELWVFLGIVAFALATMPFYGLGRARRASDPHDSPNRGTFVLGPFVRSWFYWFLGPVERASLALGLSPLFFNLAGVAFGLTSLVLFATSHLSSAGWALLLGGVADILDGRLARARDLASPRGAFLDSTLDRYAEVAAFVGLAVWYRASAAGLLLVVLGLGGSLLVSYTRARGESLGVVCKVGVMQRAERLLLLGFGAIFDPAVSAALGRDAPGTLLFVVLAVVAAGTIGTSIFRTVWIARRLPDRQPPTS